MKVKTKPNSDVDRFSMDTNPLSIFMGHEQASAIGVPTIFNQASFDSLPLVEFVPHKSLNPKRVIELLRMDPPN
jgi:hypothetical protein